MQLRGHARGTPTAKLSRSDRALLRRNSLGFVFQGFNLLARTSALENVEMPLMYRGVGQRERKRRAMMLTPQATRVPLPDHFLVLHSQGKPWTGREVNDADARSCVDCSWAFVLTPLDGARTAHALP